MAGFSLSTSNWLFRILSHLLLGQKSQLRERKPTFTSKLSTLKFNYENPGGGREGGASPVLASRSLSHNATAVVVWQRQRAATSGLACWTIDWLWQTCWVGSKLTDLVSAWSRLDSCPPSRLIIYWLTVLWVKNWLICWVAYWLASRLSFSPADKLPGGLTHLITDQWTEPVTDQLACRMTG